MEIKTRNPNEEELEMVVINLKVVTVDREQGRSI